MGLEVLSRLTDGAYDMVFVDSLPVEYPRYLDEAVRLLRPGGLVVLDDVLRAGHLDDGTPSTRRRSPSASSPGRCARTSAWSRCCCRWAAACCAPCKK